MDVEDFHAVMDATISLPISVKVWYKFLDIGLLLIEYANGLKISLPCHSS